MIRNGEFIKETTNCCNAVPLSEYRNSFCENAGSAHCLLCIKVIIIHDRRSIYVLHFNRHLCYNKKYKAVDSAIQHRKKGYQ